MVHPLHKCYNVPRVWFFHIHEVFSPSCTFSCAISSSLGCIILLISFIYHLKHLFPSLQLLLILPSQVMYHCRVRSRLRCDFFIQFGNKNVTWKICDDIHFIIIRIVQKFLEVFARPYIFQPRPSINFLRETPFFSITFNRVICLNL